MRLRCASCNPVVSRAAAVCIRATAVPWDGCNLATTSCNHPWRSYNQQGASHGGGDHDQAVVTTTRRWCCNGDAHTLDRHSLFQFLLQPALIFATTIFGFCLNQSNFCYHPSWFCWNWRPILLPSCCVFAGTVPVVSSFFVSTVLCFLVKPVSHFLLPLCFVLLELVQVFLPLLLTASDAVAPFDAATGDEDGQRGRRPARAMAGDEDGRRGRRPESMSGRRDERKQRDTGHLLYASVLTKTKCASDGLGSTKSDGSRPTGPNLGRWTGAYHRPFLKVMNIFFETCEHI